MRINQSDIWGIETAGWSINQEGGLITLSPADVDAALQISVSRKKAGLVTEEELLANVRSRVPEGVSLESVTCGLFKGLTCDFFHEETGDFWRIWSLCNQQTYLFITYTCASDYRGNHWEVVDWMLSTLHVESRLNSDVNAIQGSDFVSTLASRHPNVELLADSGYLKSGWSYFWITSTEGKATRNVAYVRVKPGGLQAREYDANGDDRWVDVR